MRIDGTFRLRPRPEDYAPCVWCTTPTDVRMRTPGRPDIGSLPLHGGCAAAVIVAYQEHLAGRRLEAGQRAALDRLLTWQPSVASVPPQKRIGSGGTDS